MADINSTKRCTVCKEVKELSRFYTHVAKSGIRRHNSQCAACSKEYQRKRRENESLGYFTVRRGTWDQPGKRRCGMCMVYRPFDEFPRHKSLKGGIDARCKLCKSEVQKKKIREDVEAYREKKKKYSLQMAKRQYGLTPERYAEMEREQDFRCAICRKQETMMTVGEVTKEKVFRLSVDHCHKTKKVRGLLCSKCNRGIGNLNDDIELVRNALAYLEKYKGE